jgi:hypothetical protein
MQVEQLPSDIPHPVTAGYFQHTQNELLLQDCQGEILMVIEPDGISDVFCRNQYSGLTLLRHAAMWCVNVRKLKEAKFYTGVMTSKGGRFHSINREKAIEHVGQWVFGTI